MHRMQVFLVLALVLFAGTLLATTSPLVPTNSPAGAVTLTYNQGDDTAGTAVTVSLATAAVAAAPASQTIFTVDPTPANDPIWLSVSPMSGTVVSPITAGTVAGTPVVLTLNASAVCASLGAGTYSATVHVQVLNYSDLLIPVTLLIKNAAPTLTVTGGNSILSAETWNIGTAQNPYSIPLTSNGPPISFTTTLSSFTSTGTPAIANPVTVSPANGGIAYTWGTSIAVTVNPLVYVTAVAGGTITGTITINCPTASPTTIAVPFSLTIGSPVASIATLFPAQVPVDATTTDNINLTITGAGFVTGALGGAETTVVFVNGTALTAGVSVLTPTTISLTIPNSASLFASASSVAIGVANPNGGTATAPVDPDNGSHSDADLVVTTAPIITTITSASSFVESGANANTFAPYDLISIFGTNFCLDCGGGNPTILTGTPGATFQYPQSLSPDSGASQHYVTVQFNKHGSTLIAQGYVLFANNTQINVLVPASVGTITPTLVGTNTVDVVVGYSQVAPPGTPTITSTAYPVNIALVDPGILTVTSDGAGQGAILNSDYSLNSSTDAATHGTGVVMVYLTGLGAPTSTAGDVTTTTALAYPASCISALGAPTATPPVVGYLQVMNTTNTTTWTALDGVVLQAADIVASGTYHYAPCMGSVTATINSVAATVQYAGWVAGSITGLYQVNLLVPSGGLPSGATGATSVPIAITIGGKTTQSGVTMYVK